MPVKEAARIAQKIADEMQLELVDLVSGRTLAEAACTNSQTQFGTNILDRILAV